MDEFDTIALRLAKAAASVDHDGRPVVEEPGDDHLDTRLEFGSRPLTARKPRRIQELVTTYPGVKVSVTSVWSVQGLRATWRSLAPLREKFDLWVRIRRDSDARPSWLRLGGIALREEGCRLPTDVLGFDPSLEKRDAFYRYHVEPVGSRP